MAPYLIFCGGMAGIALAAHLITSLTSLAETWRNDPYDGFGGPGL